MIDVWGIAVLSKKAPRLSEFIGSLMKNLSNNFLSIHKKTSRLKSSQPVIVEARFMPYRKSMNPS